MNLVQGLAFHIIAIINASFLIYYTFLVHPDKKDIENFHVEMDTPKEKTILSARIIAGLTITVAIGGIIWDLFYNDDIDESRIGVHPAYLIFEIIMVLAIYGLSYTLFYHPDYGVSVNHHIPDNQRNHAYGAMAVSYVFLSYIVLWSIWEILLVADV